MPDASSANGGPLSEPVRVPGQQVHDQLDLPTDECAVRPTDVLAALTDEQHEALARAFHEAYEALAPQFGYQTREASRVPWPPPNADLMIATVAAVCGKW